MSRLTLSLRPKAEAAPMSGSETLVAAAIARGLCLRGQYNGGEVVLQPALLYREHDATFLLAVTARRDGKPPREAKLGTFRLIGLNGLSLSDEAFEPGALHRSHAAQPGWEILAG